MQREKKAGFLILVGLNLFFILIVLSFGIHVYRTGNFNNSQRIANEGENGECTVELYPRGGIADSWVKKDVLVNGEISSFIGTTYDCSVMNFSESKISDWTIRIDVKKQCYINNAWCGMVEIHQQDADHGEIVQTVDLRDYDEDDLHIKHLFVDNDLYIPLSVGDYIIYRPSQINGEYPINAYNGNPGKIVVGFIFYHKLGYDLGFSCSMQYKLFRSFFQGTSSKIILVCFIVWFLLLAIRLTFILTSSRLKRETTSVIRAVSKIYYNLCKVNLDKDTFQEIRTTDNVHKFLSHYTKSSVAFRRFATAFFCNENMQAVKDFYDTDTWRTRLKESDSCRADFKVRDLSAIGKSRWIRTNLIVCRRNSKKVPVEVICGLQDVDEEVSEREQNKQMMERFASDLSKEVAEQTLYIQEIQRKVVSNLADMIGTRDGNTGGHVKRTSDVMEILVNEIIRRNNSGTGNPKFACITDKKGEDIIRAAPMHDLGKIFIDTSILCKPGKLTDEEYKIMKTHSEHSGKIVNLILSDVEEGDFVNTAYNIARYHHERWDGFGYPEGKDNGRIGEGIPIEARIMAVADVYDALVSKRCYKEPMSFDMAYQIMIDGMGKQFDPDMEEIFNACRADLEMYYSEPDNQ